MPKKFFVILLALSLYYATYAATIPFETLEQKDSTDLTSSKYPIKPLNESLVLPKSQRIYRFNSTSNVIKTALFYSNLCKTSNCRASLDKWDCENCLSTLPDGTVIRSFQTFPLGVTGQVILSEERESIYVVIRGASSFRSKILFIDNELVRHPLIPGVRVQRGALDALFDVRDIVFRTVNDQLLIHPTYKLNVVGHSFGGAIASLVTVDLFQRLPIVYAKNISGKPRVGDIKYAEYVSKNKIPMRRYVEENDDVTHHPDLTQGYMHEGNEYWLKSSDKLEMFVCLGPTETRSCSSSVHFTAVPPHLTLIILNLFRVSGINAYKECKLLDVVVGFFSRHKTPIKRIYIPLVQYMILSEASLEDYIITGRNFLRVAELYLKINQFCKLKSE
ncbi:Alpha/Beta hydrolase protein [Pilaira anomala]|nr:Alpha/Beta hydrolase protein [Pilaira anomala]